MALITKVNNKGYYQVLLGDADGPQNTLQLGSEDKFVPNVNVFRWREFNSESYFNINHRQVIVGSEEATSQDNALELIVGDIKERFYPLNDGVLEWEIIFASEPATHALEFDLQFSPDLIFAFQDEITDAQAQKWVDDGAAATLLEAKRRIRPENVVGSYAIISPYKRNNHFRTGKLGHLYRWICIDANNQVAWCDPLEIDPIAKSMLIRLPSAFLQSATYPVKCMGFGDTIGNTSEGASADYYASRAISIGPYMGADGELDDVKILCDGDTLNWMYVMLMTDSAGAPNQSLSDNSISMFQPPNQTMFELTILWSGSAVGTC